MHAKLSAPSDPMTVHKQYKNIYVDILYNHTLINWYTVHCDATLTLYFCFSCIQCVDVVCSALALKKCFFYLKCQVVMFSMTRINSESFFFLVFLKSYFMIKLKDFSETGQPQQGMQEYMVSNMDLLHKKNISKHSSHTALPIVRPHDGVLQVLFSISH